MPGSKQLIASEQKKSRKQLIETLSSKFPESSNTFYTLPEEGVPRITIRKELLHQLSLDKAIREGRAHGGNYTSIKHKYNKYLNNENNIIPIIDKHLDIKEEAYLYFSHANKFYPFLFTALRKFEVEIVSMVSNLLHAKEAAGALTSGGTESIFLAVKAWKSYGKDTKGIHSPNIILPVTAHPAFNKACHYLNIEVKMIPVKTVDNSYTVDLKQLAAAVDSNTICIVGSAPCFGYSVIDDIEGICRIASNRDIPVHVDNCLGGFLLTFLMESYIETPFDFRVAGVSSMSIDLHKQAGSDKGCSVIMYNEYKYREYQYYAYTEWTGGLYGSNGFAGSSNGGIVAVAWAMLLYKGKNEFQQKAIKAHKNVLYLKDKLSEIADCDVIGEPVGCGIAFRFKDALFECDYAIIEQMQEIGGWELHNLQFPMAVAMVHGHNWIDEADQFICDLKQAIAVVKKDPSKYKNSGMASVYGTALEIPDRSLVADSCNGYLDAICTVYNN